LVELTIDFKKLGCDMKAKVLAGMIAGNIAEDSSKAHCPTNRGCCISEPPPLSNRIIKQNMATSF
jgi:hypothetical protein